jgi:hypothetical protein
MGRKLIPFLAFTLLVAASSCSQQVAPLPHAAPPYQGDPCLPPGPCSFPGGGSGLNM